MRKTQIFIFGMLTLIMLLCGGVLLAKTQMKTPDTVEANNNYIMPETTVRQEVYYTLCHHLTSERFTDNAEFNNKSFAELAKTGWYVFWAQGGEACAFMERQELCPIDKNKYHLILQNDKLVIIHGPKGFDGEVESRVRVDVSKLPFSWQEMLRTGGIEFETREDMLMALESLDEL